MADEKFLIESIQFKRGTAAALKAVNPLLLDGEPCIETDTGKMKAGNGSDHYNDLPYTNGIDLVNDLTTGGTTKALTAEQGKELEGKKLDKTSIVNDLTTGGADVPLSAEQGKELNSKLGKIEGAAVDGGVILQPSNEDPEGGE